MEPLIRALADNPLLLLFVVCSIGYPLGRIKIGGATLGTASVLFVGLAIGAIDPRLKLPEIVFLFGLCVFVYTIGLSSAPGFFKAFNRHSLKEASLAFVALALAGVVALFIGKALGLRPSEISGMYSGGFTNASGLAGVIDGLKAKGDLNLAAPVVAYALAYPVGILGPIVVMAIMKKFFKVDLQAEAETIPSYKRSVQKLAPHTILVTNPQVVGLTIEQIGKEEGVTVVFARVQRGETSMLSTSDMTFQLDDKIVVVGPTDETRRVIDRLGEEIESNMIHDRTLFDYRRMFVSKPEIAGRRIAELDLPRSYGAIITRVRRGDSEFVPSGATILELGDRVRVLTLRENLERITHLFGDSYKALSDVDFVSLCLGICIGLAIGLIPIPLPGGISFRLGFAGGPLVVALIAGKLGRTGPILWTLPYSANLTLRQFGLLLFAAGIGTRAGFDFYSTLARHQGIPIFLTGLGLTIGTGFLIMYVGYKFLKIPMNSLFGIYAGAQTQPVNLAFALEQTKNDLPNMGYAMIFPAATIFKIIVAQLLFGFGN